MAEQLRGDQVTGIAAQFTLTKARPDLWERLWTARAMSSLPVPVSPVIKNGGVSRGDSGNPGKNGQFSNPSADAKDHKSPANNAVDFAGHCKFSGSIT